METPRKPNRRALQLLEKIERLPRRKQETLLTTIDAFLQTAESTKGRDRGHTAPHFSLLFFPSGT